MKNLLNYRPYIYFVEFLVIGLFIRSFLLHGSTPFINLLILLMSLSVFIYDLNSLEYQKQRPWPPTPKRICWNIIVIMDVALLGAIASLMLFKLYNMDDYHVKGYFGAMIIVAFMCSAIIREIDRGLTRLAPS